MARMPEPDDMVAQMVQAKQVWATLPSDGVMLRTLRERAVRISPQPDNVNQMVSADSIGRRMYASPWRFL